MSPETPPLVSVVIPAFNRADSIERAISSVLRQSFADFELIIVDDGSTDGTREILSALANDRVRVIFHDDNRGVSAARNTGIAAARGEWVAFQDSDDEWLPEKLERQMQRLANAPGNPVACYCGMLIVGEVDAQDGIRTNVRYWPAPHIQKVEGEILTTLLETNTISTQTLVARRDLLEQVAGFDEDLPALVDWDLVLRLAAIGPIAFVDEPLVLQYFSENSITRSLEKRAKAKQRIVQKHSALWKDHAKSRARQHHATAGAFRQLGHYSKALEEENLAWKSARWNVKYFLAVFVLFVASFFT